MSTRITLQPIPASFVDHSDANQRVKNFIDTKYPGLSAALGKNDTRAIWYAKEHLEQLMAELAYKDASGLRIYLGAYPSTHNDYPGQLCLIMVPTRINTTAMIHEDIIAEQEPDFQERIAGFNPEEINNIYKTYNFGSPCPPACGSNELTYPLPD